MPRPEKSEYAAYYETYVSLVPETEILPVIENQLAEIENLCGAISEEKGAAGYAEGKWTIKEAVGHLLDGEKIFGYRALRISRADETPMEGFEQEGYIENANFNSQMLAEIVEELLLMRQVNLRFFKNLSADAWTRQGTASGAAVSVNGLAYIMVGHIRHHLDILRERYLAQ